jgi:hypothetical protein
VLHSRDVLVRTMVPYNRVCPVSDTDIMLHHVPDEYILHTLPTINPNQTYGMLDTRRGEHELI